MYVPYDCYYHVYDKEALYKCADATHTDWIHAMGDSQEREFVAIMKTVNGSKEIATKFEDVRWAPACTLPGWVLPFGGTGGHLRVRLCLLKAVPAGTSVCVACACVCLLLAPSGGLPHARLPEQPAHHVAVLREGLPGG